MQVIDMLIFMQKSDKFDGPMSGHYRVRILSSPDEIRRAGWLHEWGQLVKRVET